MSDQFELLERVVSATLLAIISLLGLVFNYGILHTYFLNRKPRNEFRINAFTYQFTIASFLNSILYIVLSCPSAVYGEWMFGYKGCRLYGFLSTWFDMVEIYSITTMACFQMGVVKGWINYGKVPRRVLSIILHMGIWTATGLFAALPLFGYSQYAVDISRFSCTVDWKDVSTNHNEIHILIYFLLNPFLPLFLWVFILRKLWRTKVNLGTEYNVIRPLFFWQLNSILCSNFWHRVPYAFLALYSVFRFHGEDNPSFKLVAGWEIFKRCVIIWNPYTAWCNNEDFMDYYREKFFYGFLCRCIPQPNVPRGRAMEIIKERRLIDVSIASEVLNFYTTKKFENKVSDLMKKMMIKKSEKEKIDIIIKSHDKKPELIEREILESQEWGARKFNYRTRSRSSERFLPIKKFLVRPPVRSPDDPVADLPESFISKYDDIQELIIAVEKTLIYPHKDYTPSNPSKFFRVAYDKHGRNPLVFYLSDDPNDPEPNSFKGYDESCVIQGEVWKFLDLRTPYRATCSNGDRVLRGFPPYPSSHPTHFREEKEKEKEKEMQKEKKKNEDKSTKGDQTSSSSSSYGSPQAGPSTYKAAYGHPYRPSNQPSKSPRAVKRPRTSAPTQGQRRVHFEQPSTPPIAKTSQKVKGGRKDILSEEESSIESSSNIPDSTPSVIETSSIVPDSIPLDAEVADSTDAEDIELDSSMQETRL